jgi:hypothetical protein
MKKQLLRPMLVALVALLGLPLMAQTPTTYDFEDGNALFTADSRIGVNVVEGDQTIYGNTFQLDGKAVRFTGANNAQNGYSFAHYDFSSLCAQAAKVKVEFDCVLGNGARSRISIGDATVRGTTGNSSKTTYSNKGAIFMLGTEKSVGYINGTNNAGLLTALTQKWLKVTVEVDETAKTYTYSIVDKASGTELYNNGESPISFWNSDATNCTQIDLFGYINNSQMALIDNLVITVTKDEREQANYTVNFLDSNNAPIKEAATRSGAIGDPIVLLPADKEPLWNTDNTQKYIYQSDNAGELTIAADGTTAVNIIYRDALVYNYTVVSNLGATLAAGTGFEGETPRVGYPRYQLSEGKLYMANVDNKEYRTTVTLSADNVTKTVTYSQKEDVENPVFYTEAEEIEGMTVVTNDNIPVRASNAKAAISDGDVVITTLPAGKYIFHVGIFTSKSSYSDLSVNFGIGNEVFAASFGAVNLNEIASEEYVLNANTTISVLASSSANTQFDYIWIEKTGDVEMPVIEPAYGEIWSGTKAFPVEEYESISLNTAYFKDFVKAGDVIKVTLQPAAEEARAEAPMRDIKRFGELALLAADESIIAENGEVALDTEDYSFTVEESWIEKLSTGNNIYLRGRNLTVTKIELLEAVFEPVDCTAKVSTENWLSEQGSVGGPVTLEGIAQKEQYNASTTAIIEGDVLYQVVEGLQNGTYKVELYANASFTSGRGFTSDIIDGQLGRVVVYAGDVDKTIPVFDQGWVNTNNIVTLENVVVSDGTLRMGLKKIAPGTNWHTIQIKSLTQVSNKAEADADAQDTYWKGIAATVAAYEAYANVAGSEKAAIVAAETKAAAQAAIPPFYAAKPSYDALAEIIAKANSADYDVAEAEALMASTETTAEQAAAKAAELLHPVTLAVNTKAVEGASKDNPIETNFVVNGTFDTAGVIAPWKSTTGAQNQTTANNQHGAFGVENSFFFENWNPDPFTGKMYQEIEDIPNGLYTLKICAFVNTFDATAQYVYANTDQTPLTTGEPTAYEVQTNVTTNTIEIGLEQTVAVANWMGVDNVSLIYKGDGTATAINEVTAKQNTGNAIYNLQGQKVQNARKGLYIINGKKVLK